MYIDLGPREFGKVPRKTQYERGLWPDLHEADLPRGAARSRVIAALNRRDGIGDVRRQIILFGFASNELLIKFARLTSV